MRSFVFRVADLVFSLSDEYQLVADVDSYHPFLTNEAGDESLFLFHLELDADLIFPSLPVLSTFSNEFGAYSVSVLEGVYYWKLHRKDDSSIYSMKLDISQKRAWLNFRVVDTLSYHAANDFIRFAYIYTSALHHVLLLHASCIVNEGRAIAFIGPSGAGKSTHSALWMDHIAGSSLLNDDQPAVYADAHRVVIYGTPWSGKTPCYHQKNAPLQSVLLMVQDSHNELKVMDRMSFYSHLLSACSLMKADRLTFPCILHTLAHLAEHVSGGILRNKADKEAVGLSFEFFKRNV